MVSNIPFGSYQPEWMDYLKTYSSIFGWNFRKVHKTDEEVLSLLTGNPSTDDNFAAMFCSLERTPSNKLNFPYPDIIYQNLHYTLCKNYLHYIHYLNRRQSFHRSYRNTASVRKKSDLTICLASGFFFFLASLAWEGKIKQITDDKGRDDRRLAKRKKSFFGEIWIFGVIHHLK